MAKSGKIKDHLEFSYLGNIFVEKYNGKPAIKDIAYETGLPFWFISELSDIGYLGDKLISNEVLLVLNTACFCRNSGRFIKSAINRMSGKQRGILLKTRKQNRLEQWLCSRVDSYKEQAKKICIADIFYEAQYYFPILLNHPAASYAKVKKTIDSYTRKLRRLKKDSIKNSEK